MLDIINLSGIKLIGKRDKIMQYDVEYIRRQFPALGVKVNGFPAAYFDGPGGTQVPQRVIDSMVDYLVNCNANAGGAFLTSCKSDKTINEARAALADFLGAEPDEIAFGHNTTTMMFQLALALGREQGSRNEILITEIDHEANRGPWLALEERGFIIREARFDPDTCTLDMADFKSKLNDKTLVATFNYASNGVGTVSDVKEMVRLSHKVGAITVIDAVHFALHGPIDVKELDTDFLLCSAYKFFGPHIGVFYGRREQFEKLPAYRLRVQYDKIPYKIETGTLNHEGIAGAGEAVEFIADIGSRFYFPGNPPADRRSRVVAGMKAMESYEQPLAQKMIDELTSIERVNIYGPPKDHPRTSTVSFTIDGISADKVATALGEKGLFVWDGHFYAACLVEKLGLDSIGGLVRVGLSPYNTEGEIDRLLAEVKKIAT
ncbi:MAG: cysteine desulfurase-like protein [Dethiobacteria bacterium]